MKSGVDMNLLKSPSSYHYKEKELFLTPAIVSPASNETVKPGNKGKTEWSFGRD